MFLKWVLFIIMYVDFFIWFISVLPFEIEEKENKKTRKKSIVKNIFFLIMTLVLLSVFLPNKQSVVNNGILLYSFAFWAWYTKNKIYEKEIEEKEKI